MLPVVSNPAISPVAILCPGRLLGQQKAFGTLAIAAQPLRLPFAQVSAHILLAFEIGE